MKLVRYLTIAAFAIAIAALTQVAPAAAAVGLPPAGARPHTVLRGGCAGKVRAGFVHCELRLLGTRERKPVAATAPAGGYAPADLQSAYNLPSSTGGAGQTVAIVDAYDDPTAESDLATYRSNYGLPPCTTANGCFKKVNQGGGQGPYPANNQGWGLEISLDLDMVSAVCPQCHILLVEANSNLGSDLYQAVNTAANLGATEISNSYGGPEFPLLNLLSDHFFNHPGVAITASSGDAGYGVEFPASSPFVTAVGGTTLTRATNTRGWNESAWGGAGSGCSRAQPKPFWQSDSGCGRRTVADVSADANPASGVNVFDSNCSVLNQLFGQCFNGWGVVGGTSVGSPMIASVYALAGNAASVTYGSFPYSHTSSLFDVTSGSNGSCSPTYLCTAGSGYDGPTGLGTPNGTGAF